MIVRLIALLLIVAAVSAVIWQHQRYLRVRREVVGDLQPLLYSSSAFHALTFVRTDPESSLVEELRRIRRLIETSAGGSMVYAGAVGAVAVTSAQVSNDWNGLFLAQYPSRETHDEFTGSQAYRDALAHFQDTYTHGIERPAVMNLAIAQGLLALRIADVARRVPSSFPFVPAGDDATPMQKAKIKEVEQLNPLRSITEDAVVIFNLIKPGNADQRRADRSYALKMMSAMAEGGYGPLHMGKAVTIEGDADFDQFAAVYYPGIDFVQKMIGSTFMSKIGGDKQLGDSIALITVPLLSKL